MNEVFGRVVHFCSRRAALVAALAILLGAVAGVYAAGHFALNSSTAGLISPNLDWRKREIAFGRAFPQLGNLIVVVVDGATPERAEEGAAALAADLSKRKALLSAVRRPDGGDFFAREGLLFLPLDQVNATTAQMIKAQAFLGALAADPSLRGTMDSLSTALLGVTHGQASLNDLHAPIVAFANVLGRVEGGKPAFLSWRTLIAGGPPNPREIRRFILVNPKLNFRALSAGGDASNAIRQTVARLRLTPDQGVRVRLTGQIPLADEEFGSLADHAGYIIALMMLSVLAMLWFAVRSPRIIAAILLTLFIGLAATTAFGLIATSALNLISVAFVPLFVGLGVDFGIQFCVRYRAERHALGDLQAALAATGRGVGTPLALAAIAIAGGFLAFVPTDYAGVAELGLIAGFGMLVAFTLSITALPAFLMLLKPSGEAGEIGYERLAPLDHFLRLHRRKVLIVAGVLAVAGAALITRLGFDFNPLHLKNAHTESVSTLYDIMHDPLNSPNDAEIIAPSLDAAAQLAKRLSLLHEVGMTLTLNSFIPAQQTEKLAAISDASMLLDTTINPFLTKPPPSDAEDVTSLNTAAANLRAAAGGANNAAANDARKLAGLFETLAKASPQMRARAADALIPALQTTLEQLRQSLKAGPVTPATLPADLKRDWLTPDGHARIEALPGGDSNDNATIKRFTKAVLATAPDAIGPAISIPASSDTIVRAFIQAGLSSLVVVTILLAIALRRARDVMLALASILLSGLLALGTCVAIGLQINFANIIALPLLFGIGVAFNIYYLMAWRGGRGELLHSPLGRAIVFSALTTASGFGSLWLSRHPGTASMGELLMISLGWTIVTSLFFLPALLGPPRESV